MLNEDFNEVADQLAKTVSTSRSERVFFGNLVTEIRDLDRRLKILEGVEPEEPDKPAKTTKKKTTTKTASKA